MFKSLLLVMILVVITSPVSASMIAGNWQFNTPGDNEGWTATSFQVNNLYVGAAVQGSETVLTCTNLRNQADPRLYFPDEVISLPAGATSWESLTYRIRQIGTDGVTPVPFDNAGTIGLIFGGSIPTIAPIPTASNPAGNPPVSVVSQPDEWLVITWDLTAYSGDINAKARMDPIAGTAVDGEILGNFEIDFVTLTAVPEPASLCLLATGCLTVIRRRN